MSARQGKAPIAPGVVFGFVILCVLVITDASNPAPARAQKSGEELFRENCAPCHVLGSETLVGPGLAGVTGRRDREWLVRQIAEPDRLIESGDSIAGRLVAEYGMAMPNLGITPPQAEAILDYMATAESPASTGAQAVGLEPPSEEQIVLGRALFEGTRRPENGGPACNACHDVAHPSVFAGGSLARELTDAHSRLGGPGIRAVLENPPFPVMRRAYADAALTDEEVVALVGFLGSVDAGGGARGRRPVLLVFGAGVIGFALLLGVCSGVWRNRRRRSVNHEIFDRQVRTR